jgi:type II secretory ATPase GspE/PulE/Tfp pilus assembly ATPase PilB-like protein
MPLALRALMRNDPDVALVGEIPDLETAQLLQSMALTGHLVLAQAHTFSAAAAAIRFIDVGVDPHIIGATLIGIVGMRLARRICPGCKSSHTPSWSDPTLEHLRTLAAAGGYDLPEDAPLYRGRGCDQCRNTGYRGRTGLYEILLVNPEISAAIMRGASAEAITDLAVENGMRTLIADGMRKAVDGVTTFDEVRRVTAVTVLW